jgi:adenylate cyclase
MRRATKRRVRIFLWLVLAGALIGAAYGGVLGRMFRETGLIGGSIGAIDGAAIAIPIGAIEVFGLRTRWGRAVQRAPFLVTFGLKWLAYGAMISIVNLRSLGVLVLGLVAIAAPLPVSVALWSVAFSFAVAFAFVFVFQVSQIVGPRTFGHLVFGRYHRPHLEDRFFLFVDIRGSTTLAERIGPIAVHRFLAAVFSVASDPIADHGGEIYQYVGDEMVVTWPVSAGRRDARPLACFFAIEAAIEAAAGEFEREFGVVPRLRAALHAGPVIGGEVGDSKREIVFHGDVMNTAARLEQATRDLDRPFLVSAQALGRLDGTEPYAREALGPRALRGREAPVEIYAVTAAR